MRTIRQLDTNLKLYAAFGVLTSLTTLLVLWMLAQLSQMHGLSVKPGRTLNLDAAALQANYDLARIGVGIAVTAMIGVAALLALWLKAEMARPIDQAVAMARRVAEGDLSTRSGERNVLLRTMQEMNDQLVSMIVRVRSGTESIASGAAEIAGGSMDLSARTEEQAASLEETATSMEQLTATVKQNAEHAHQASKLALSASEVAVKGGAVVAEVVGTMASINDSSTRIAEIIGVIDGIAFQTNILALNAAVEAARAGEQGRGFAVVAAEVRSLAQRSAAAAKEIKSLIDDSVEKVSAGTMLADKAGKTMHEVVASVKRVTEIIGEIADASAEQTVGIEQVNKAIAAMDQATQHNAALVESSAAAAAAMRDQAGGLSRLLGGCALGPEHARPASQLHLAASNPNQSGKPRSEGRTRPNVAPVRAVVVRAGSSAARPVDWEEF